jgi:undecaprenyl-diphosphatase
MESINHTLFLWLNAPADALHWHIVFAIALARWLVCLIPFSLTALWCMGGLSRRAAVNALIALLIALAIDHLLREIWFQPRPFMIGLGQQYLAHQPTGSFPSNHTATMLAAGFALRAVQHRLACGLGWLLLVLAVPVAWARIYLGVHMPFDNVGALGVALVSFALVHSAPSAAVCGWAQTMLEAGYRRLFIRFIARGWLRP